MTHFRKRVKNSELPAPLVILDSAFTCAIIMVTPEKDDEVNIEYSSLQINVQCAFGQPLRRWGILCKPIEMEFRKMGPVF